MFANPNTALANIMGCMANKLQNIYNTQCLPVNHIKTYSVLCKIILIEERTFLCSHKTGDKTLNLKLCTAAYIIL